MTKIVSLCKRRGFIYPGSEIYGGLANTYDYGPLGAELKNNIKQLWWKKFVQSRDDMVGIDTALIMNPKVWEASGHLKEFSDPLVECKKCHNRFRKEGVGVECPDCGGKLTEPKQFNLMFKTFIGPAEEQANTVYLRPETAQGMFVNFKNILDTTRKILPFGIAQIGKAFRNEITPGNFIFRLREFEMMEIEYFIRKSDWKDSFENWRKEMRDWIENDLGLDKKHIHEAEIPEGERAHYSKRTIDFEYEFPFGRKELYGLAYRENFDLKNHQEASGADLKYHDPEYWFKCGKCGHEERFLEPPEEKEYNIEIKTNRNCANCKWNGWVFSGFSFIPHVIEPTWGVDRSVLTVLTEHYSEEGGRVVLKLPFKLAPYKAAVFPLLANKPDLVKLARKIYDDLRKDFMTAWDDRGNIGKRYYSQDEIGTPFCITVDFESLEKDDVTVRDRDTMKQERIKIKDLPKFLAEKLV